MDIRRKNALAIAAAARFLSVTHFIVGDRHFLRLRRSAGKMDRTTIRYWRVLLFPGSRDPADPFWKR
jgi:hypothetical protein